MISITVSLGLTPGDTSLTSSHFFRVRLETDPVSERLIRPASAGGVR